MLNQLKRIAIITADSMTMVLGPLIKKPEIKEATIELVESPSILEHLLTAKANLADVISPSVRMDAPCLIDAAKEFERTARTMEQARRIIIIDRAPRIDIRHSFAKLAGLICHEILVLRRPETENLERLAELAKREFASFVNISHETPRKSFGYFEENPFPPRKISHHKLNKRPQSFHMPMQRTRLYPR